MSQTMTNYYELLGVTKDATPEEIEFVFQEIKKFLSPNSHPEKTYTIKNLEEIKQQYESVKYAYQVLINPVSRAEYDEWCKRQEERAKQPVVEQPVDKEKERRQIRDRYIQPKGPLYTTPPMMTRVVPYPARQQQPIPQQPVKKEKTKREKTVKKQNAGYPDDVLRNETFWKSLRRQYREVRQDEKSDNFSKRHTRWNGAYHSSFAAKVDTIPKEILYYTGQGLTHVSFEGIYQIAKLRYINKDIFTKFLIRNRRLIAVATAAGIMFSTGIIGNKKTEEVFNWPTPTEKVETQEPTPTAEPDWMTLVGEEPRIVLNRNYTIVAGDTLSRLASTANSSIKELKQINGYDSDRIYYGRKMLLPYTIDREDLKYYTESVKVNNYTIEQLAKVYETDVETLKKLNPEAIVQTRTNSYLILSDTLIVPRFITKTELVEKKREESFANH